MRTFSTKPYYHNIWYLSDPIKIRKETPEWFKKLIIETFQFSSLKNINKRDEEVLTKTTSFF